MKFTALCLAALLTGTGTAATIITETFAMNVSVVIPDADLSGMVQTIKPITNLASLDRVTVTLVTSGGWNGDLYAYLWHDGVLSVLINRPGRTAALPDGAGLVGMSVEFADAAFTDIHLAPGAFTGSFQPDGRDIHPLIALDTSPRNDKLSDFLTTNPGGDWKLFIADVAGGDEATLVSWSISLTGPQAIPEPGSGLLIIGALCWGLRRRRGRARLP